MLREQVFKRSGAQVGQDLGIFHSIHNTKNDLPSRFRINTTKVSHCFEGPKELIIRRGLIVTTARGFLMVFDPSGDQLIKFGRFFDWDNIRDARR